MAHVHPLVTLSLAAALSLGWASTAAAHKPTFAPDGYAEPAEAFRVGDPDVSIVVYRDVTCEAPELWMTFEAPANYAAFVQLLVPQIERLADYRPSVAVLGPGLPARDDLPFAIPGNMGAVVFETGDITDPEVFDEPFTGTTDWMLVEETVELAEPGKHYVVAWDPAFGTGKLAVALGDVEDFGIADALEFPGWVEQARTFHETEDYPPAQTPVEEQCATPDEPGADQGDGETDAGSVTDAGVTQADAGTTDLADAGSVTDAGEPAAPALDASTDADAPTPTPTFAEGGTATPDAGQGFDAGASSDTDPSAAAGTTASGSGGGCAAAGSSPAPALASLALVALAWTRRRRSGVAR